MADGRREVLRHSVLDRLSAEVRDSSSGGLRVGVRELKQKVRRDLEWLLNSRRIVGPQVDEMEEVRRSILGYGLPDFSSLSQRSQMDQRLIGELIVETIRTFEPRLGALKVELIPSERIDDFRMRYRIDAVLHIEPIREPITFDTFFESDTGGFQVEAVD